MLRDLYRLEDIAVREEVKSKLSDLVDEEVYSFIDRNVDVDDNTVVLDTDSIFSVDIIKGRVDSILNFRRLNNIKWLNKYLEAVNSKLNKGGLLFGCVETYSLRRQRILKKYNPMISYPFYFLDFVFKRVFPRLKLTRLFYKQLTHSENRALSRVEVFGRLYASGFELVSEQKIKNILFFVFRKKTSPKYVFEPNEGFVIKLKRIGQDGRELVVRKLRTMYSYSEFLQGFIYDNNMLAIGGKFNNDYRITPWGKIFRSLWIDELPMLWNWVRRDIKLVGVRPLSKQYFEMYDDELKQLRVKYKPGLIPPFYADLPGTFSEIMESEKRYLSEYEKHPVKTQWQYFWKAFYNIVFRKARSN